MKVSRIIWLVVGCISFVLGTLGTFLPILPTVPLYLLAVFGFANSSQKLHDKFVNSYLYDRYLADYINAGGIPFISKMILILLVTVQCGIVAAIFYENLSVMVILGAVYLGFLIAMIFIVKTVPPRKK